VPFLNPSTSHYDPTLACGGASDNALCSSKGGCVTDGTYTCDAAAFAANPWACEVGDMSGKYGKLQLNSVGAGQLSSRTFSDYLPLPEVLDGMSIVFHCGSARAFCAKLEAPPPSRNVLVATFKDKSGSLGVSMGSVTIDGGDVRVALDLTNAESTATPAADSTCFSASGLSYHIHELWTDATKSHGLGSTECGPAITGGHYDPAFGCGGATHNPFCKSKDSTMCVDGSMGAGMTTYSCNPTEYAKNPFACEVGDLSGKFGKIPINGATASGASTYNDVYMSSQAALLGKSIVFHCGDGGRVFCAKLNLVSTEAAPPAHASTFSAISISAVMLGQSDVEFGRVNVKAGAVDASVDLSKLDAATLAKSEAASCKGGDLSWHIHTKWVPATTGATSGIGPTECGSAVTGG